MIKKYVFCFVCFGLTMLNAATLDVNIVDIKRQKGGFVALIVCDQKTPFPCKKTDVVAAVKRKVAFEYETFTLQIPNGTYAIAAMHDENNNGILDKNFLGIPVEGYAISGGEKRAEFEKAKFVVVGDTKIDLHMRY